MGLDSEISTARYGERIAHQVRTTLGPLPFAGSGNGLDSHGTIHETSIARGARL